jgi:hypothetical protein
MFTSVASASTSPPSRRPQNPTTGKSQPEQNSQDQNTSRQIYFFDSIDPKQHFATVNYCIAKGLFDHAVSEREEVKAAEYRQAAMLCSAASGVVIGFWDYFRVGAPLTIITLAIGTLWLWR